MAILIYSFYNNLMPYQPNQKTYIVYFLSRNIVLYYIQEPSHIQNQETVF
nr:MAG TPA: hypothetical protein [Caudoviricetes sp.]